MYFFAVSSSLPVEKRRVGRVADGQKQAGGLQFLLGLAGSAVQRTPVTPSRGVAEHLVDGAVPDEFDFRVVLARSAMIFDARNWSRRWTRSAT